MTLSFSKQWESSRKPEIQKIPGDIFQLLLLFPFWNNSFIEICHISWNSLFRSYNSVVLNIFTELYKSSPPNLRTFSFQQKRNPTFQSSNFPFSSPPSPWQPLIYLSVDLPIWDSSSKWNYTTCNLLNFFCWQYWGLIPGPHACLSCSASPHVAFSDTFFHSIVFSTFTHAVTCITTSFLSVSK
jgi:hypothetical protein